MNLNLNLRKQRWWHLPADRVFFTSVVVTRPSRTYLVTIRYLKPIPTHRNRSGITPTSHEETELTSTLQLSKVQNTETFKNRHAFSYLYCMHNRFSTAPNYTRGLCVIDPTSHTTPTGYPYSFPYDSLRHPYHDTTASLQFTLSTSTNLL